jgi:hypothetical protein
MADIQELKHERRKGFPHPETTKEGKPLLLNQKSQAVLIVHKDRNCLKQ